MPQNYPAVLDGTIAFKELKDQIEDVATNISKELHNIKVGTKEAVKESKEMCDGPLRSLSSQIQDESQNNEENWENLFQRLDDIQTEQVNLNAKFMRNRHNLQVLCIAMTELLKNQASERTKLTDLTVKYEQAKLYLWIFLAGLLSSPWAITKLEGLYTILTECLEWANDNYVGLGI